MNNNGERMLLLGNRALCENKEEQTITNIYLVLISNYYFR
jgi:hypothetical protein